MTQNDTPIDIQHLQRSAKYRVRQPFADFYNNQFREGELLTFVEYKFLPYHGGHTVVFEERNLYLQDQENANVIDFFGMYFSLATG